MFCHYYGRLLCSSNAGSLAEETLDKILVDLSIQVLVGLGRRLCLNASM